MIAVIGFLTLVILGSICMFYAALLGYMSWGFSGVFEWSLVIFLTVAGSGLMYLAFTHSPFIVSIAGNS